MDSDSGGYHRRHAMATYPRALNRFHVSGPSGLLITAES
jgi:hypothetical protein